jgi:hypothetical protein
MRATKLPVLKPFIDQIDEANSKVTAGTFFKVLECNFMIVYLSNICCLVGVYYGDSH